jgi:uncharacterized membrane protein
MTAPHADQIIDGYMARLDRELEAAAVPAARRREILDDIQQHVNEARAGLQQETDADLLNILDRMGDPAEVVAATRPTADQVPPAAATTRSSARGWLEIAAIVFLFFFWPLGMLLLWLSEVWSRREKWVATWVFLGFWLALPLVSLLLTPFGMAFFGLSHLWITSFFFAGPFTAIVMAVKLGRHRPRAVAS